MSCVLSARLAPGARPLTATARRAARAVGRWQQRWRTTRRAGHGHGHGHTARVAGGCATAVRRHAARAHGSTRAHFNVAFDTNARCLQMRRRSGARSTIRRTAKRRRRRNVSRRTKTSRPGSSCPRCAPGHVRHASLGGKIASCHAPTTLRAHPHLLHARDSCIVMPTKKGRRASPKPGKRVAQSARRGTNPERRRESAHCIR